MPKKIDTAGLKHFKGKENAMIAGKPESTNTATVAHAVGEYFYWKGVLHIVTAAIAVGGTIQTNTNVKPAVLADDVGALKTAITHTTEYEADGKVYINTDIIAGEAINNQGVIVTKLNYTRTGYIPVNEGDNIYISSNSRQSSGNAWYDVDKQLIGNVFNINTSNNEIKLTAPTNAKYLILCNTTAKFYPSIYRKNKSIERVAFNVQFTEENTSHGFINGNTGSFNASDGWIASDFVALPMPNGGTMDAMSTLYGNGGTAFYDVNKKYISGVNGNSASAQGYSGDALEKYRRYTVPEGTAFVRICLYKYAASYTAERMYIASASIGLDELCQSLAETDRTIYAMNETESMYVNAGANYGHHSGGYSNTQKRFSMLVTTDVHADATALKRAVDYLNVMPCFDCGTCLGDLQGDKFSDNDGTWYTNAIKGAKKPWLTLIGNHDVGIGKKIAQTGTQQQVYEKFIEPNYPYAGIEDPDANYYYKDFATYKIRTICLCAYDVDDNTTSGDEYVVSKYTEYYSQEQITWFVNTLASTPSDYQVIVMIHNTPLAATKDTNVKFNNKTYNLSQETTQDGIIADIVNAWQNGTTLSDTYTCSNTNLSSVTVDADFSSRGTGVFICYLTGHMHIDFVGHITRYPSQTILAFSATNTGTYQNGDDDIPRADYTKAEDCITSFAVDTTAKNIYIVRIGASVSKYFDVREPSVIPYT